ANLKKSRADALSWIAQSSELTRDMSKAPSEASQPDLGFEIPRTVNAVTMSPPVTPRTSQSVPSRFSGEQRDRYLAAM
ncbi:hypothetical protein E4U33_002377, partial [Claviceps sp. LM78 group G4]